MSTIEPFSGTYPDDDRFWVSPGEAGEHPPRYGDLYRCPNNPALVDSRGKPWKAVMVLHPSCEMDAKGAPSGVQLVRVHLLRDVSNNQRDEIRTGYREREFGVSVARINMVYLAPPPDGPYREELFADLRNTARIPLDALIDAGRIAALSHEARLAVMRRDLLFRYRWDFPISELAKLERDRIGADLNFKGPRPDWAPVIRSTEPE